ncbi:MAG: AMP-binding protein [Desulfobacula sp.]|uniref:AMP-binding protein n=1 Tax=Desulfobacula sp. TaxID=2593537 RepID=UPI0039B98EF2|nr:AMP-binding protein [Desulfobacula sp.]
MLVNTILENSAQKYPDKIALVCNDERLCYKEINNKAAKFSSYLIKAGIKRHDRVAIFIDNSAESVIALFGVLKAGATFVMLSASMKPTKLNYILQNSGASFLTEVS